ncbi:MAG: ATP-binding protein [Moraxellaceae bacterium]
MTVSRWRSPILRLALTHATAFLLAFLILGSVAYFTLTAINEETMQRTLRRDLSDLHDWYGDAGISGLQSALSDRAADADPDAFYLLQIGTHVQRVPTDLQLPATLIANQGWHDFDLKTDDKTRPALAKVEVFADGSRLLVGHIAWERERLNAAMHRELGIGLFLVLIMAVALAFIMSRAIARALAGPLAVAHRFADGQLDARATPNNSGDSFDRLALTLNAMFARIQDLVGGIAHTTDAIAHDLRTPLARLKTRLEEAHRASRDPKAQAQVEAAISETDKLLATFQAMLRLARLEADTRTPENPVDLRALVQDAAELFEALAEDSGQTLTVQADALTVQGDRDQLFQMLVNLIDNAIKYAPDGSAITLTLRALDDKALLSVSDNGPGIPEADRERVFDRFVRLESHRGSPGNGLGLALVRAIVLHHGGRVRLQDAQPGLHALVELPLLKNP